MPFIRASYFGGPAVNVETGQTEDARRQASLAYSARGRREDTVRSIKATDVCERNFAWSGFRTIPALSGQDQGQVPTFDVG